MENFSILMFELAIASGEMSLSTTNFLSPCAGLGAPTTWQMICSMRAIFV
jgi:hypothetical protein